MRTGLLLLIILLLAGYACNRSDVEVEGVVKGGEGSYLTLERLDVNRTTVIDSVKIGKGGFFSFKTRPEEPELYLLRYNRGEIINLLLHPGDRVSVSTVAESFGTGYKVDGSEESENIRNLVEHLARTRYEIDSLSIIAEKIEDAANPQMDIIRNAYVQTIVRQKRYSIRYLIEHLTSLSTVYALYQKYDAGSPVFGDETDLQYFIILADSLESVYPNSSLTKSLRADIERRQASFEEAAQMNTLLEMAGEASGLLDLSIPDRDGNEISLSSLKGKVVLVVFWASADEESIRTLLQLKSTYKRYSNRGFEVYAISLDNKKIPWMNAIDFNEFKWYNVSELSFPESRAAILYNVSAIPTTFLIDRDGNIVAKNLYGRTLETWLDNLL